MKKRPAVLLNSLVLIILTILMAVPNLANAFNSFRCGTKLVRVGDTKGHVLNNCGPPTVKMEGRAGTGGSDVWVYNRGSVKTSRILRFTGSQVTAIDDTVGYGYAEGD